MLHQPSSALSGTFSHPSDGKRRMKVIAFFRALAWEKVPKGDEGWFNSRHAKEKCAFGSARRERDLLRSGGMNVC